MHGVASLTPYLIILLRHHTKASKVHKLETRRKPARFELVDLLLLLFFLFEYRKATVLDVPYGFHPTGTLIRHFCRTKAATFSKNPRDTD